MVRVKICGLVSPDMIESAALSGADRIGLVLAPTSPRAVTFDQSVVFAKLIHKAGCEAWVVVQLGMASGGRGGASVDELVRLVQATPEIDAVQLHGGETPAELADFRARLGERAATCRIVKALGVAAKADLEALEDFEEADAFLLDAKPPKGADREGGFGQTFDWTILQDFAPDRPWLLSGGLTPQNVAEAIRVTGAQEVDVSSGVESAPGVKDAAKVRAFIEAAKAAG